MVKATASSTRECGSTHSHVLPVTALQCQTPGAMGRHLGQLGQVPLSRCDSTAVPDAWRYGATPGAAWPGTTVSL